MVKDKPWTSEEKKKLRTLFEAKKPAEAMVKILGKSNGAIRSKLNKLGLKEVATEKNSVATTSCLKLPKDLPTVERALQTLVD